MPTVAGMTVMTKAIGMRYKGMVARYAYIPSVCAYVGEIVNCPDVVSFSARSLPDLEKIMAESVDNYLDYRKQLLSEYALEVVST